MSQTSIAIDIGGTRIKLARVTAGQVEELSMLPAHSEGLLAHRLQDIEEEVRWLIAASPEPVAGIGIGMPCLVDPIRRRATEIYSKFEDAPDLDLAAWCEQAFGLPMVMEQDSKAALLGELHHGCGKGIENAVMIIMGTGVGTAVVMDGRLLNGKHFSAGSLGSHIIVEMRNGRKCTCPGRGCLEAYTSGWALPQMVREHPLCEQSPLRAEEKIGFRELEQAMNAGDPTALDVFNTVVTAMRAGIVSMIHAYDPEAIIFSGGPLNMGRRFTDPLLENIESELWGKGRTVQFLQAQNPDGSVVLGLHYLTLQAQKKE